MGCIIHWAPSLETTTEGGGPSREGKLRGKDTYMGMFRGRFGVSQVKKVGKRKKERANGLPGRGNPYTETWG